MYCSDNGWIYGGIWRKVGRVEQRCLQSFQHVYNFVLFSDSWRVHCCSSDVRRRRNMLVCSQRLRWGMPGGGSRFDCI